jgi:hypothetical protein
MHWGELLVLQPRPATDKEGAENMSHYEKGTLLKHRDHGLGWHEDGNHGLFLITGQALGVSGYTQEAYSFKHGCHVRIYVRFFRPVRDVKKEQRA